MNLSRRELLKLGGAVLVAPLARYIPDLELPEHPLLSPAHRDICNHEGISGYYNPSLPEWDIYTIVYWTSHDLYVSRNGGDTWVFVCSRSPWMVSINEWYACADSIAEQLGRNPNNLAVSYALEMGS